jgi:predicted transcriptional regulator
MTKLQIRQLLEKAYGAQFLDSVEVLLESNKDYVKSEFYKNTRIPLVELYKNYVLHRQSTNDLLAQIDKFILEFNVDIAIERINELLVGLDENEKFKSILNKIIENLNPEKIEVLQKQIEEVMNNFKK